MAKVSFITKDGKKVSFNVKSKSKGGGKSHKTSKRKASKPKKSHKANKQHKRSTRSVTKKGSRKGGKRSPGKKSFIDKIPILNNKTVQKVGFGLGMGVVAIQLINLAARFAPPAIAEPLMKNQRIIKLGVEAATEPISAIVDIALSSGMIEKFAGGNGMSSSNGGMSTVGFA